jgi:hypothetical protein
VITIGVDGLNDVLYGDCHRKWSKAMTNANEMYFVIEGHRSGPYAPERECARMDRETTIVDVMSGQFGHISKIYAADIAAGTFRDATKEIAQAVADRCNERLDAPSIENLDFLDRNSAAVYASLR